MKKLKPVVIRSARASTACGDTKVPKQVIEIRNSDSMINFRADAAKIVNTLIKSLPGGTLDQVMLLMFAHYTSRLTVPSTPQVRPRRVRNSGRMLI